MLHTRAGRVAAGGALVAALAIGGVLAARGFRKPYSPAAPDFRSSGPADAKVVIVEFSDFQCPACRYAEDPLRKLLAANEGKVRFVFKHFPLERAHPHARPAAIGAECAGRQGRFWDFHHRLYDQQETWSKDQDLRPRLKGWAKELKLDAAAWEACLADPAVDAAVSRDQQDGLDAWVGSTPTFFVNGKRFVGALQLQERAPGFVAKELAK